MLTARRRWRFLLLVTCVAPASVMAQSESIAAHHDARNNDQCIVTVRTVEQRSVSALQNSASTINGRGSTVNGRSGSAFNENTMCSWAPGAKSVRAVLPWVRFTAAGGLPAAQEDGTLWNGRGMNTAIRGGVTLERFGVHVAIVPDIVFSSNQAFDHEPSRDTSRSSFASPFHFANGGSLDLPKRFGAESYREITPGASAAFYEKGGVAVGWSAAPQQWGPGQRGSLMIGAASAGIPRVFVRSAEPFATKIGVFDAVAFLGTATESRYFDRNSSNDFRSLSGAALSWSPRMESRFVGGVARGVMRASDKAIPEAARFADALSKAGTEADEMVAAFARVGRNTDALSGWVEVARNRPGFGVRSFLTLPYDAMSYLVGMRGATDVQNGRLIVLFEAANLEQGEDVKGREPRDFYTGQAAIQGWTQRGRPIGHWIGPGAQSQYLSIDWVKSAARFGIFAERVRRDEDALFREYLAYPNRHDVQMEYGARAALAWKGFEVALDGSIGRRINFEFQNAEYLPTLRTVDVNTPRLRLSITPLSQR